MKRGVVVCLIVASLTIGGCASAVEHRVQQDATTDVARTWSFSVGRVRDPYVPIPPSQCTTPQQRLANLESCAELPKAGDRFVAVDITVKNVSNKVQQTFPWFTIDVEDPAGHRWTVVPIAPSRTGASNWWENIDPATTEHATLRSEVPASARGLVLVFWPNPLAPKQRFPFR